MAVPMPPIFIFESFSFPVEKIKEGLLESNHEIHWTPGYIKEGKRSLTVAIGCTGGQHRSVALTKRLAQALEVEYKVNTTHRDKDKRKETVNRS